MAAPESSRILKPTNGVPLLVVNGLPFLITRHGINEVPCLRVPAGLVAPDFAKELIS